MNTETVTMGVDMAAPDSDVTTIVFRRRSYWTDHDMKVTALIRQVVKPGVPLTADQVHTIVNTVFVRARVTLSAIRGALSYMVDNALAIRLDGGLSLKGRKCKRYAINKEALVKYLPEGPEDNTAHAR